MGSTVANVVGIIAGVKGLRIFKNANWNKDRVSITKNKEGEEK